MTIRALAAALVALGGSVAAAGTTTVPFSSNASQHKLGHFEGTATYDSSGHTLTIVVKNDTSPSVGGDLTSFAFDAAGDVALFADPDGGHKPNTNGFDELRNRRGMIRTPFGAYHAGAGLDGKWSASHDIARGIAAGATQTFVFDVSGPAASSLHVSDFLQPGKSGEGIVAAFKGLSRHRADRAGGIMTAAEHTLDISGSGNLSDSGGPLIVPPTITDSGGPTQGVVTTTAVPLPPAATAAMPVLLLIGAAMLRCRRTAG